MATNYLRGLHVRADDDTVPAGRFGSSRPPGVKRDGLEIKTDSWELENYRRNPVFLFGRLHGQSIADRLSRGERGGKNLIASVTFDPDDEFARQAERKYRNGFLYAVSVGWDSRGDTNELLDISAVPVPGDPTR